jgi:hypothetical protein
MRAASEDGAPAQRGDGGRPGTFDVNAIAAAVARALAQAHPGSKPVSPVAALSALPPARGSGAVRGGRRGSHGNSQSLFANTAAKVAIQRPAAPPGAGGSDEEEDDLAFAVDEAAAEAAVPASVVEPTTAPLGRHMLTVVRRSGGNFKTWWMMHRWNSESNRRQAALIARGLDMIVGHFGGDAAADLDFFELFASRLAALKANDDGHSWAVAAHLEVRDVDEMVPSDRMKVAMRAAALEKKVAPASGRSAASGGGGKKKGDSSGGTGGGRGGGPFPKKASAGGAPRKGAAGAAT